MHRLYIDVTKKVTQPFIYYYYFSLKIKRKINIKLIYILFTYSIFKRTNVVLVMLNKRKTNNNRKKHIIANKLEVIVI